MAKDRTRHIVCAVEQLPSGERIIVELGKRSIGVFNIGGSFHAVTNVCPHQLAPLCKGTLAKTAYSARPDQWDWDEDSCVIRCPWHGWEFDLRTGRSVFNPHRTGVRTYEVAVEGADLAARRTVAANEEDPKVETFDIEVEREMVVLYL
jgi:nitrite reductase/ring-hydroxylating ferredoxin subunit